MMLGKYDIVRSTRASRAALATLGAAVLLAATVPLWGTQGAMAVLAEFFYFLALAQMWNLLAGYGGLVSIGQQAFVGVGAYTLVGVTMFARLDPLLGILGGALVAGVVAWPASRLLFRLQGPHFAIGSWVFAEVLRLAFANYGTLGGGSGISITEAVAQLEPWWRDSLIYWASLAIGIGALVAAYILLCTGQGLALMAIRDSEPASESLGVSVRRVKTWVYILTAMGTGMIGALIFLTKLRVSPDAAFSIEWSALIIFIVIIGGVGTIEGPLIGTIVYFVLRFLLADFGPVYMIALGAIAIATMLFMRDGLWGWAARRFDLQLFATRRRLVPRDGAGQTLALAPASRHARRRQVGDTSHLQSGRAVWPRGPSKT